METEGVLKAGTVLANNYVIQRKLAEGTAGRIYLAQQQNPERVVAVKEIEVYLNLEPRGRAVSQFHSDVKQLLSYSHPAFPTVYESMEFGTSVCVAMEYVSGQSIVEMMGRAKGQLDVAEVVGWADQICDAFAYLHNQPTPFLFRDFKPANLMLDATGRIRIVGFGLSRLFAVTRTDSTGYVAPERYQAKASPDVRSDLYSLGATLYYLLTSERPADATFRLMPSARLTPPSELNPHVPPSLEEVVLKMMALTPADRYASLKEARLALSQSLEMAYASGVDFHLAPGAREAMWLRQRRLTALRPVLVGQVRSLDEIHAESRLEMLLEKAEDALSESDFATVKNCLDEARTVPKADTDPQVLDAWSVLAHFSPRTGLRSAECRKTLEVRHISSVAITEDGQLAAVGSFGGEVRLYDLDSGRRVRKLEGHLEGVFGIAFNQDGSLLASASADGTIGLWDTTSGALVRSLTGHEDRVYSVAFSPDGRWLISGGTDNTLRVWETSSGRCLRSLPAHSTMVLCVAMSADGRWALTGSQGGTVRLWDLASGKRLQTFEGHTGQVGSVALSPDGTYAYSASYDRELCRWEVATDQALAFEGHTDNVYAVTSLSDGRYVMSGSEDATVGIWEVKTGDRVRSLKGHGGAVRTVAVSGDGRWVLSGSADNTVRLWELEWELTPRAAEDWDDAALAMLQNFLLLHSPYAAVLPKDRQPTDEEVRKALTRKGTPAWTHRDFERLLSRLQQAGLGYLRAEGVYRRLVALKDGWQGAPGW
ncbi:MAG: WD40 repeat domain-containing serine/threonine protein kinase [Candidatus Xenobia bacterium]